jgi:histone deacetylase complex regulatory component SIN3
MNIETIATATITLLSPYLAKMGEEAAKKAGDAAWKKAAEIHATIKARFKKEKDEFPSKTLEQFEKNPEKRKGAMQDVLTETLDKDPDFAKSLLKLLTEAEKLGTGAIFNVTIFGGEVGEIINVDRLEGGLEINKGSRK